MSKPLCLVHVLHFAWLVDASLIKSSTHVAFLLWSACPPFWTSVSCFHLIAAVGSHFKCIFSTSKFHIRLDILHDCPSLLLEFFYLFPFLKWSFSILVISSKLHEQRNESSIHHSLLSTHLSSSYQFEEENLEDSR